MRTPFQAAFLALAVTACTSATPEPTDQVAVDPDVSSWTPDSFPPAEVARAVFMGDSITDGYRIPTEANTYPRLLEVNNADRWPDFDGVDLGRYGEIEAINVSRNGAVGEDLIDRQIPALRDMGPFSGHTLVFITIGGNDLFNALLGGESLDGVASSFEQEVEAAVLELEQTFPDGVSILLANVYEPTDGEGQANDCFMGLSVQAAEPVLDDLNGRTLELAKTHGFAWADMRGHFLGHGWNHDRETIDAYHADDPSRWFQEDCIHPNPRGHHEIRRLFMAALDGEPLPLWVP